MAEFRTIVGRDPGSLDAPSALGHLPVGEAEAEAQALTSNPKIFAARYRVAADKQKVRSLLGQLLPQVNAIAEWQDVDNYLASHIRLNSLSVGVEASIPLYQAGYNYSQIREARDRWAADDKLEIEAEREVRQQVDAAWEDVISAKAQQQSYNAQIHANQIALNDTIKEVTVGTRTRLDTLNADQELFQSQVDLVGADHDELLATFQLETAIGAFTPQALGLDVAPYDPGPARNAVSREWFGTQPPQ
jgi:outer membrane protein